MTALFIKRDFLACKFYTFFSLLSLFLLSAVRDVEAKDAFRFFTESFARGGNIPAGFAMKRVKGGRNISPSLIWKNAPENTKSFVITCIDHAPIARRWVHWMVINIPSDVFKIKENASCRKMPKGSMELKNSFGFQGYGGPQPPKGSGPHRYVFTIYALNVKKLHIESDFLSERKLKKILKNKIIAKISFYGFFER